FSQRAALPICGRLVLRAERSGSGKAGMREEAEDAEPIVDGDHDRVATSGHPLGVVTAAGAHVEAAAVHPHDDRTRLARILLRRRDVEVQTVLARTAFGQFALNL